MALVTIVTFPWEGLVWHSHWARVEWLPFQHTVRPLDAVLNLLLYVPGGWLGARWGRSPAWIAAVGIGLSLSAELLQVWSHGRSPSATDLLTNGLGLAIGAGLASRPR